MKQIFLIAVLIVIFCFDGFARSAAVSCPEIQVLGPSKALWTGESAAFYALVGNRLTNEYQYFWSVTAGTIIDGQETSKIKVDTTGLGGMNITATVKVSGLPSACNDQGSETASVASRPSGPHPSDDFSKLPDNDVRGRLDSFFVELQNDPQSEGLIILYFEENTSAAKKRRRIKLISDHLKFRKMDPTRITFAIQENGDYERTVLWRVPNEAKVSLVSGGGTLIKAEYLKDQIPYLFK